MARAADGVGVRRWRVRRMECGYVDGACSGWSGENEWRAQPREWGIVDVAVNEYSGRFVDGAGNSKTERITDGAFSDGSGG